MKLKGRAKAVTKNIEGKAQEAIGKATGNRQDQVAGKAKQVESQVRNAVEDVKDTVQDITEFSLLFSKSRREICSISFGLLLLYFSSSGC